MNKLIIALSVACASACVFAADNAIPKVTSNEWFTVASGTVSGGSFDSEKQPTYEGGKYVIDSEPDSPVTFTADEKTSGKDMTEVSFTLDTSIVPADARQNLSTKGKVAFAASEASGDAKAYFAWLGVDVDNDSNGWVQLEGADVKEDNASYKLDVTFDNREGSKKVQFKVDGTALTANGVDWLAYASPVSATELAIDLVGSGSITSIYGNQLTITAEVVPVDGGKIEIKEEDVKKFDIPTTMSKDAYFAQKADKAFSGFKSDISVGAAYALGLIAENESTGKMAPVNGGELIAKALAETPDDNGIKLGLNVTPPQGTGATIDYLVVDENKETTKGLVIPSSKLGAGLMKFTVKAIVTPAAE